MMGQWLSERLGNDYLTVGFGFYQGSANAIPIINGAYGAMQANVLPPAPEDSFESAFVAAGFDRAILDQRNVNVAEAGGAWWMGGHAFREIGALWNPTPHYGVVATWLPARFHILIFTRHKRPLSFFEAGVHLHRHGHALRTAAHPRLSAHPSSDSPRHR